MRQAELDLGYRAGYAGDVISSVNGSFGALGMVCNQGIGGEVLQNRCMHWIF